MQSIDGYMCGLQPATGLYNYIHLLAAMAAHAGLKKDHGKVEQFVSGAKGVRVSS